MKRFILFLLLVVLLVSGLYYLTEQRKPGGWRREKFTPAERPKLDLNDVKVLAAMEEEYTKLVDAVVPSVVSIIATRKVPMGYLVDPFALFGRRFRAIPQEREQTSLGSGVIVSKEGHIVTNSHVIANVDAVKVQLHGGREAAARIIGADESSDIAILKIDEPDVQPLPFADSDKVRVGERVIAVGNPFGLEETVTQGIVSAKGRRAMHDSANEFFQTDAAINPGNSGGPLVSLRGEIIGINSSIFSGSGGWQGVGFAIPSNVAKRVLKSILEKGRVVRGYLGVMIQPLTADIASQLGIKDPNGAFVAEVTPGSPAEKAGIRKGDVIRKLQGRDVKDAQELRNRVAEVGVGSKADVVILRDGKEQTIAAEIAEQPADLQAGRAPSLRVPQVPQPQTPQLPQLPQAPPPVAPPAPRGPAGGNALSGVKVAEIPRGMLDQLPENVHGVIVTEVDPDSPAAASLQRADVIEEINRQPVNSVADFERIASEMKAEDKPVLFIARGKTRSFVVLTPR